MAQKFPIFYSSLFLGHDTGATHPENAGRLTAVVDYLKNCQQKHSENDVYGSDSGTASKRDWATKIQWINPSDRAVLPDIYRVHEAGYVKALEAFAKRGGGQVDADTIMSTQSYDLALLAVAAWLDGADWVGQYGSPAFALVRPPGHHAEYARGMGFCLLSNAAIAAHYALANLPEVNRVAILDWDVHHGNGTQSLVEACDRIAYCSFHQSPAYPGTGAPTETGLHNNVLNIPMSAGSQLADYQALWKAKAQPFLKAFDADFMIVSAGYDANHADPLASVSLQPEDYGWFTQACMRLTPKILFGLEGGYDYRALAESVAATIQSAIEYELALT